MRVLVTGAGGLVGREVVAHLLATGHDVHGTGRSVRGPAGVKWHRADLLSEEGRRSVLTATRPEVALHLAWETQHGWFWTAPSNLNWVSASLDLARQAVELGCRRFVGAGSWVERADDGVTGVPATLYGTAKHATCSVLSRFFADRQVEFAWARLFNVFGPGEPDGKLLSTAARSRLAGKPFVPREPSRIYDFIDARDAAAALATTATGSITGIFDIGTGRGYSVAQALSVLDAVLANETPQEAPRTCGPSIADLHRSACWLDPGSFRPLAKSITDLVATSKRRHG